jgi:hypothetical protein
MRSSVPRSCSAHRIGTAHAPATAGRDLDAGGLARRQQRRTGPYEDGPVGRSEVDFDEVHAAGWSRAMVSRRHARDNRNGAGMRKRVGAARDRFRMSLASRRDSPTAPC